MNHLNAIQQLIDLLNSTQQTHFCIKQPETSIETTAASGLICMHQVDTCQIFGHPSDQAQLPLLLGMLSLMNAAVQLAPNHAWLSFLSGQNAEMPDSPAIEPDKTYRLCLMRGYEAPAIQDLLALSAEVLSPEVLYSDTLETLLLMEASPTLNETLLAFYETASLELGQTLSIYLSAQAQSPDELPDAFATLKALEKKMPTDRVHTPIFFEAYLSELLFEEWLSHKPGPIFKAIRRQRIVAQFDEETLRTIEMLFQKNLNLTDTAKALFIHRNTLIYRLDKIEKLLGFDLRQFEDCFQLKLLLRIK